MTHRPLPTRLLVVHGDDDARTFLRRRFARLAHEVVEAGGHDKAMALVATTAFDLVLLDLQVPGPNGESGLDLLRRLRETRTSAELPILAVAGEGASEDVVEALALGADDCLMRPLYIEVAQRRAEMLIGRRSSGVGQGGRGEFQIRLERLEEAADRAEAVSAVVEALGREVRISLNGLLGAAAVLTSVCRTPELAPAIETIEGAAAVLDLAVVRALGRADRRARAPKPRIRVLLADQDIASRLVVRELLDAAEVQVDLIEVDTGFEAALATDADFFDLIIVSFAAPEAVAGIRKVRWAERQNNTRRTPILVFGAKAQSAAAALEAGADLYVRQPVTAAALLSTLADALARESEDMRAVG